jgi:predicted amidohydrolase
MPRLALIQMRVDPGEPGLNLARAVRFIQQAAESGSDIALLPEALDFGWSDPSARHAATGLPGGETFSNLSAAARRNRICVCAGLAERAGARLFNSAVFIDRAGNLLLRHRKVNELKFAHELYALGDGLGVADTEFGRLGLMICADAFIAGQVLSRSLAAMGARLILSPCSWAVPAHHDNIQEPYGKLWIDNYAPVAAHFHCWIAGVSNVGPIKSGPWALRKCIGASLLIGPDGRQKFQAPYGEDAEVAHYFDIPEEDLKSPASRPAGETPEEQLLARPLSPLP